MACNIGENIRRRKWQQLDKENAPCCAQKGFANVGTMAKDWWVASPFPQTAPEWLFLTAGVKLSFKVCSGGFATFEFLSVSQLQRVQLIFKGFNEFVTIPPSPFKWTVEARLDIATFTPPPGVIVHQEQSDTVSSTPAPNDNWVFQEFKVVLPISQPLPSVIPPLVVMPLKACNNCS